MALNEQAVVNLLKGLVSRLAQNFRTEAELVEWHQQIDGLIEEAKDDLKTDAEIVAVGEPIKVAP